MESMYEQVLTSCNEETFAFFRDRLIGILEASNEIGWGYPDSLEDIYYSNAPLIVVTERMRNSAAKDIGSIYAKNANAILK